MYPMFPPTRVIPRVQRGSPQLWCLGEASLGGQLWLFLREGLGNPQEGPKPTRGFSRTATLSSVPCLLGTPSEPHTQPGRLYMPPSPLGPGSGPQVETSLLFIRSSGLPPSSLKPVSLMLNRRRGPCVWEGPLCVLGLGRHAGPPALTAGFRAGLSPHPLAGLQGA